MTTRTKLVVWGGSAIATPELVDALRNSLQPGEAMDVVLVGRTAEKLQLVGELCCKLAVSCQADLRVSYTTDLEAALEGADYILNQVRVGGLQGRAFDESFPRALGLPGEETVGPGGFSSALRTIPAVLKLVRVAEKLAPRALILNLTNPSSLVQYAIRCYSAMPVLGTCDAPVSLTQMIAKVLELPDAELEFDYVGMHHAGWVTGVRHRGRDVMPLVLERADRLTKLEIDPQLIRAIGAVPSPYFRYYFHPDRMLAKTVGRPTRAEELMTIQTAMETLYARPDAHERPDIYSRRGANWYKMIVVPVLLSLMRDSRQVFIVDIDNNGTIPWLPPEGIIEVPCIVGASGAHALTVGAVPLDVQAFLQRNCAYEMLAVQAIVEGSYEKALRALLLNPLIRDAGQARAVLEKVWPDAPKPHFVIERKPSAAEEPLLFPTLVFGRRLLEKMPLEGLSYLVVTMEEPWQLAAKHMPQPPEAVLFVRDMEWDTVEAAERALPTVQRIVGIGGGSALDMAKYVAWKRNQPCYLVPSITSVDAFVTKSVAVREQGNVRYIGFVIPEKVYVDYELIRQGPARLNRAGAGDIICAHTALWDWALAHDQRDEAYDEQIAAQMQSWLNRLEDEATEVRRVTNKGIRFIVEAFAEISKLCRRFGSSRPQEASEHIFAYNVESITRRHFIHGELVALGTLVMAVLQENNADWVQRQLERLGILYQPADLGITREEFEQALRTLPAYARATNRRFSVVHVRPIDEAFVQQMSKRLRFP
nr:iron-containing alcohol dehydrogenase [Chloroflexota bacterium]